MSDSEWDAAIRWLRKQVDDQGDAFSARIRGQLDWNEWPAARPDAWDAYTFLVRFIALAFAHLPDFPEVLRIGAPRSAR